MGDYGIKISKPGKSAFSTDIRDFIVWSKYPVLKIHSSGSGSIAAGGTETINHGLGYNPIAMFYVEALGGGNRYTFASLASGATIFVENTSSDVNNVYLKSFSGQAQNYYYFIYYDETLA